MKQSLLSMLLLVTLAGCVPSRPPSPQAATITPPPVWRTDLTGTAQIDIAWWRQFGDPALSAQVEAAIANNPDIAIAAARVREARAQEALARRTEEHTSERQTLMRISYGVFCLNTKR